MTFDTGVRLATLVVGAASLCVAAATLRTDFLKYQAMGVRMADLEKQLAELRAKLND